MPISHLALALAVVFIWGTNFVVIKWGLAEWPPLVFVALRFILSSLPILVLRRPAVRWQALAAYGLLIGVGQFGLMFLALRADITPGLASLLVQMQVFFTLGLAAALLHERVRPGQLIALACAVAGMGVIAWHRSGGSGHDVTARGVVMVLGAALAWAGGNLVAKRSNTPDMLAFVAWSSVCAALALVPLALATEGVTPVLQALHAASWRGWAAVAWQAVGNTLVGYTAWNWLLQRHPAAQVTPLALGVPVFGMGASALLLGESLPAWKLVAAALVLGGLALNVWVGAHHRG